MSEGAEIILNGVNIIEGEVSKLFNFKFNYDGEIVFGAINLDNSCFENENDEILASLDEVYTDNNNTHVVFSSITENVSLISVTQNNGCTSSLDLPINSCTSFYLNLTENTTKETVYQVLSIRALNQTEGFTTNLDIEYFQDDDDVWLCYNDGGESGLLKLYEIVVQGHLLFFNSTNYDDAFEITEILYNP